MTCKIDNLLTLDYISFNRRDFINLCCNYDGWRSTKNIGNKLYSKRKLILFTQIPLYDTIII